MKQLNCNYCFHQHFSVNKTKYGYQLICLQCGESVNYYTKKRIENFDKCIKENGGVI